MSNNQFNLKMEKDCLKKNRYLMHPVEIEEFFKNYPESAIS